MKVGDLVIHKSDNSYGTIVSVRSFTDGTPAMAVIHWTSEDVVMLHTPRQIEVIDEKQV